MLERAVPFLKVLIVVLLVALVALTAGLVRYMLFGRDSITPRTELERGILAAEEAVKANPQDQAARVKLAAAYLEARSVGTATQQANIAIRLDPTDPTGFYILGLCQDAAGDRAGAQKSLTKAVGMKGQLAGFYADAWASLAKVQERDGKQKEALKSMGKALDSSPENSLLLFDRAQMRERMKDYTWALDDYESALSFDPEFKEARDAYDRLRKEQPQAYKKLRKAYPKAPEGVDTSSN